MSENESENCSVQLLDDWAGATMIEIDGIHFVPTGFDEECGFEQSDLDNGLQERIWKAATRAAKLLGVDPVDCGLK